MSLLPRRLNARIILKVSCVLLATGVTFGWMTARDQTISLLAAMRQDSSIMARNFAESCARHLLVQDYAELESFLLKSVELPDIRRLQVCEPNGTLIWNVERSADGLPQAKTGIAHLVPPASRSAVITTEDDLLVVWQPIEAGSLLGWLKADFSMAAIHQVQAKTWQNTLLLAVTWIVGSAFLIVLILRPIVRSIGRLTDFSKQLEQHKGTQISVIGQPLEIAELAESLNEASAKLLSTERQLLDEQQRLRESAQNLTRANADLQRFTEVAAHHLQEPVRRMANYAERLTGQLSDRLTDDEARLSLEFIGQESRRQQALLRDVERYLASDQPRGKIESVNAQQTVARILERSEDRIRETGAEIASGNLPPCRIDLPRLNDVFSVALDNALTHGRSQRPLHIEIAGERLETKVRYSISDNGPGVEAQYRERVFRVFERLTSNDAVASTGIGLAILRRVAESCDGRAWIEETPGGGCRLLVELPVGEAL